MECLLRKFAEEMSVKARDGPVGFCESGSIFQIRHGIFLVIHKGDPRQCIKLRCLTPLNIFLFAEDCFRTKT